MIVRPEIAALRDSDVPQRQAQDALHAAAAAWREHPASNAVLTDFERFADGAALSDCPMLGALFAPGSSASATFTGNFIRHFAAALAAHPLAHMPQRHFHDALSSTLALARKGPATLTLLAIDGGELASRPAAQNASFWPGEAWEAFIAGMATAQLVARSDNSGPPSRSTVALAPGVAIARDAAREAFIVQPFGGILVSLRLQRRNTTDAGAEAEEVSLASGAVVHRSAGRPRDSRLELMMATLGQMGRNEAAPHCAAIALSPASAALRWQALRECLALDTAMGIAVLREIGESAADPLRDPAKALYRQLLAQYPQLAEAA